MSNPRVSIVTAAFNAKHHLAETVRSVQAQTLSDWEMLIVDDGSHDDTVELAKLLAKEDPRLRVFEMDRNHGRPSMARNLAMREARGRYLAFLDSDDLWLPQKLERQIAFMQEKDAALSFTQYRRITKEGSVTGRLIDIPDRVTYSELLKHNVIACLTAVVDTEKTGPLQTLDGWRDDFLLWLKVTRMGFVAYGLKEDLARYRVGQDSISKNKWRAAIRTWRMYRESEHLSIPQTLYNFMFYAWRATRKHQVF